ncbi:hypothetical protein ACODT5_03510 [Streptomyces sp. 5.8]|uniref:hypothetical protein n=1 Tax=Streptomyces sp. 5.8 TaxID=3406571 RepID=UPI003BB774F1
MPITMNAHQLARLVARTIGHIGDEYTEQLHGIRLEADDTFLYAIASDRYTVAAARYRHGGLDGESFARTIPAGALPSLREWASARAGECEITVSVLQDRVRFTAPDSDLGIAVSLGLNFFNWRSASSTRPARPAPCSPSSTPACWTGSGPSRTSSGSASPPTSRPC